MCDLSVPASRNGVGHNILTILRITLQHFYLFLLDKKWLLYDTKQVLSLYSMSEVLQCELCGLSGLTCYKSVVEA